MYFIIISVCLCTVFIVVFSTSDVFISRRSISKWFIALHSKIIFEEANIVNLQWNNWKSSEFFNFPNKSHLHTNIKSSIHLAFLIFIIFFFVLKRTTNEKESILYLHKFFRIYFIVGCVYMRRVYVDLLLKISFKYLRTYFKLDIARIFN